MNTTTTTRPLTETERLAAAERTARLTLSALVCEGLTRHEAVSIAVLLADTAAAQYAAITQSRKVANLRAGAEAAGFRVNPDPAPLRAGELTDELWDI